MFLSLLQLTFSVSALAAAVVTVAAFVLASGDVAADMHAATYTAMNAAAGTHVCSIISPVQITAVYCNSLQAVQLACCKVSTACTL